MALNLECEVGCCSKSRAQIWVTYPFKIMKKKKKQVFRRGKLPIEVSPGMVVHHSPISQTHEGTSYWPQGISSQLVDYKIPPDTR